MCICHTCSVVMLRVSESTECYMFCSVSLCQGPKQICCLITEMSTVCHIYDFLHLKHFTSLHFTQSKLFYRNSSTGRCGVFTNNPQSLSLELQHFLLSLQFLSFESHATFSHEYPLPCLTQYCYMPTTLLLLYK